MKELTVEELFKMENPIIIDIRSPIEFKTSSIPGAINIPLFSDEEREEVGTIYTRVGSAEAKWRAMEFVSPKLPDILHTIKQYQEKGELVIHCWRGGNRSKAVVTFLEFAGIYAWRLAGGYRAYRQYILQEIPEMIPDQAVVIHGMTGVGKTEVLKMLSAQKYPVLDLEAMAGHRGSIFGTIGLGEGNNQKIFDSLLFKGLQDINGAKYFLVEAESKRIGKAVQPEELMTRKYEGINIHIHSTVEQRVKQLIKEYVLPYQQESWFYEKISYGMELVLRRIKDIDLKKRFMEALTEENYPELITLLLVHYYDPMYEHARQEYQGEFIDIFADNPKDAAKKIAIELEKLSYLPALTR